MGFAEALSDDGSLTGRGHPRMRGAICGLMTALGGIGHTLPFLIPGFTAAMTAALQVGLGGVLVFATGVLIGSSQLRQGLTAANRRRM